jgi:hypothetical protein
MKIVSVIRDKIVEEVDIFDEEIAIIFVVDVGQLSFELRSPAGISVIPISSVTSVCSMGISHIE